ncbi:ethanolamine ammonia-lyase reactivating factor EutA [Priestia megaterium NCT-2]|uniref:ethanolamine ammonia-lyase reactivating factor EutA n=1 Tax=Priestia megaterium TaxID=1404 RepID=UPI0003497F8F|nr:ethanolamine ammonia-lyase reactivating factor EutA [Priestia megaterium]AYE51033.1 ethanolamine ammonia-lyase reactivating factor EutA [Priestia megaterium NCT-2]UMZ30653.1 ethanolamine ammonia-lyase reactivating factor EutA [Priestia megaterium]
MLQKWITSIGLDIGTSTTKLIVSKLLIANQQNQFTLPGCQIIDRRVTYASSIYTTPMLNDVEIDVQRLTVLLEQEYKNARISLDQVEAGAVIITGETARKQNAESIVHYLAEHAGDFVVATAGADLEGILAAKGSGAIERSAETNAVIANIDVGGGTANIALCQNGKVIETFTLHVGGRLIRLNEDGLVTYVSSHLTEFLKNNSLTLREGEKAAFEKLSSICQLLAEETVNYVKALNQNSSLLVSPHTRSSIHPETIMVSGGVGAMMKKQKPKTVKEVAIHGDVGPLLAYHFQSIQVSQASETTRATVIGAGMQNTEVSGSTVYIGSKRLPLKNIPIIKIPVQQEETWNPQLFQERARAVCMQASTIFSAEDPPAAIALSHFPYCSYKMLQELAKIISDEFIVCFRGAKCLVVLCEQDIAKALGQALAKQRKELEIICLDQIDFTNGDYIDLGLPVAGEAISVSVKTLAFSS